MKGAFPGALHIQRFTFNGDWLDYLGFDTDEPDRLRQEAEDTAAEEEAEEERFPVSFAPWEMAQEFPDWARAEHKNERRLRAAEARPRDFLARAATKGGERSDEQGREYEAIHQCGRY